MKPFAAVVLALAACRADPAPPVSGTAVRSGKAFHLEDERGKVVLLSFGYTSCLEICPLTFATVKEVLRDLGPRASEVQFVYVTVDPERDRPESFGSFLRSVDPRFEGVFAEGRELRTMLDGYQVVVRKRLPDASGFYSMDHTAGFWGIDRAGKLRFRQSHESATSEVVAATRKLVEEQP